jgi:molybdenum cofactor guanylyltransferase
MPEPVTGISAIVLAGGQSRPMGHDKRVVTLNGEGLLRRVLHVLEPIFAEILLVTAGPAPELNDLGHRVMADLIPGSGSLGGVYTGLAGAGQPRVFVAGCDMPLLNAGMVRYLATVDDDADVVMAQLAVGLQPTHAVYSKACLRHLEAMARAGHLKLQKLLEQQTLTVRILREDDLRPVDPDLLSFFNVNTPADLELARKLLAGRGVDSLGAR